MSMMLNPYFSFRDTAEKATTVYRSAFGGELSISRFGEHGAVEDPAGQNKVVHVMPTTETGMVLMASDTPNGMELAPGDNVSVGGDDEAVLRRYWERPCEGGTVTMPLDPAPWGGLFGMCTDRHGIHWMSSVSDES